MTPAEERIATALERIADAEEHMARRYTEHADRAEAFFARCAERDARNEARAAERHAWDKARVGEWAVVNKPSREEKRP